MSKQKFFTTGMFCISWNVGSQLLWQRVPDSFPAELGTAPTIHGSNVGEPMPVGRAEE